MAIIEVVKWDPETQEAQAKSRGKLAEMAPIDQTYAWKFDGTELSTWTQLIVHESQEAVLFRGGSMDGPFGPGRHVLKTENLPVIGKLLNLPFGRSPFTAEVWYTNKAIPLDVQWGTREPIRLQDSKYGIVIPVSAHGQYAVQIQDSKKFLVKLVGTMTEFNRDKLKDYFRGLILTIAKTTIAKKMSGQKSVGQEGVSVLEIATYLSEISDAIKNELDEQLSEFGLKLVNFFVNHIDVLESDPSIIKLREALANAAQRSIEGFTYQQERTLNTMEGATNYTAQKGNTELGYKNDAPQNSGINNMVGLGVGLGIGVPLGQSVGQQFTGAASGTFPQQTQPAPHPQSMPSGSAFAKPAGGSALTHEQMALLKSLGELKGILSDEQFEAEKRKIMGY